MSYEGVNRRKHMRRPVALPVRVRIAGADARTGSFSACTLDIAPSGARISHPGVALEAGQVVTLERGKERSMFRVVWVGADDSSRKGQVGLQCVEGECKLWQDMSAKKPGQDKDADLLRAMLKR